MHFSSLYHVSFPSLSLFPLIKLKYDSFQFKKITTFQLKFENYQLEIGNFQLTFEDFQLEISFSGEGGRARR